MKKYTYILLAAIFLLSCTKNEITTPSTVADGARIKIINASLGVPAQDYFIGDKKLSPQLSSSITDNAVLTSITTGVSYLSTFPSNEYAVLSGGTLNLKLVTSTPIPAISSSQTFAPNTVVATQSLNAETGKYYSVFSTGYPDKVDVIITEDNLSENTAGMAYVRFVNVSPTAPALDLALKYTAAGTSTVTEIVPMQNVSYKGNSGFKPVPASATGTGYTFQTRLAGTSTALGALIPATGTTILTPGRYYTIFARGLTVDYVVPNKGITLRATTRPSSAVTQPEIYYNPYAISFYTNK